MARDLVLEDYPEAVIEIIDPKAAGIGEGYLSMLAVEARDAGKTLDQVKEELLEVAPKLRTYFLVDDLYHLMRGDAFLRVQPSSEVWSISNPFFGLMKKAN